MKRVVLSAALIALAACSDTPTQAPLDVQPQFATVVGSGATWQFKGWVLSAWGNAPMAEGDLVEGKVVFTITSEDSSPWPCQAFRSASSAFTYTVNGLTYTMSDVDGAAVTYSSCDQTGPSIQINATPSPWEYIAVHVTYPANDLDFPVVPPPLVEGGRTDFFGFTDAGGFRVVLTELAAAPTGPATKADCLKGGWAKYGFKNQGQCVKYIETGKDSR